MPSGMTMPGMGAGIALPGMPSAPPGMLQVNGATVGIGATPLMMASEAGLTEATSKCRVFDKPYIAKNSSSLKLQHSGSCPAFRTNL